MTFKEKIDKILSVNTLGINSVSAFEDIIGAGRGAINEFYKEDREPGRKTLKKIKSFPGLNSGWYESGKGPVFLEKGTEVTNKEKESSDEGLEGKIQRFIDFMKQEEEIKARLYKDLGRLELRNEQVDKKLADLKREFGEPEALKEKLVKLMDNVARLCEDMSEVKEKLIKLEKKSQTIREG